MLTDNQIKAAIKACTAETVLNVGTEGKGSGSLKLLIRKFKSGVTATWLATWKRQNKRGSKALGRYPELSLKDARRKFEDDVSPLIASGKNPHVAVTAEGSPTVERLFRAYVDSLVAAGKTSSKEVEYALLIGKYAAADSLGRDTLAGSVEPADVSAYLAKAFARGARVAADRARAYMAAAFTWGAKSAHDYRVTERRDWGIRFNPVTSVPRDTGANKVRERNLTADELRAVWFGIEGKGYAPATTAAVRLLICCGQRVRETMRVDGVEIDMARNRWDMPAPKTKGKKYPHTVPLPPQAVAALRPLVEHYGAGPLFPGRGNGRKSKRPPSPYMTAEAVNRALVRLAREKGITRFQARDLRRTWKSRAADAGIDRFTRDLIQQHAKGGDTGSKHYDRADYLPQMTEAMAKWSAWLSKVL